MKHSLCRNCDSETTGHFCANCGQKTDTHRITLKHFVLHDLLHGIWHLERGILFTLKETITRPGQAALDYIGGKRIKYYNVFYLALLLIGLNLLLNHLYEEILPSAKVELDDTIKITDFLSKYMKLLILGIVPVLGLNASILFRKLHLNCAEHFIIGGIALLGMLLCSFPYFFINFINQFELPYFMGIVEIISFFLIPIFPIWVYYNATKNTYPVLGFLWRISVFYILLFLEIFLTLLGIALALTGKPSMYFNL